MQEKRRRDRLMELAGDNDDWVAGFCEECWWSRVAQPALHSFSEASAKSASPCASSSTRSPKTILTPKPSPATGCMRPSSNRPGSDSGTVVPGRSSRERDNHALFGVVLPEARRHGKESVGLDLGQRELAHKSGDQAVGWRT